MDMINLDKYAQDYDFLQQDDSFTDALNTLSELEIKLNNEKEIFLPEEINKYEKKRSVLYAALQARVNPELFYDCWVESLLAGTLTTLIGLGPTMTAYMLCGLSGYDKSGPTMRTLEAIAIGMFGGGFGACAGHYILSKLKGKDRKKKAEMVNLNIAYKDYFESLLPFKRFDAEIASYNEKKAKEIGMQNIADALKNIKEYIAKADRHFKLYTYGVFDELAEKNKAHFS